MAEHPPVLLRKRSGGAGLTWEGTHYEWPEDGSVTEVPYDLAVTLLGVQGADYSVEVPGEGGEVTEPAPSAAHKVTEPAPKAGHAVSEGSSAPESGDGSPITPKPRAATRPGPARGTAAKK